MDKRKHITTGAPNKPKVEFKGIEKPEIPDDKSSANKAIVEPINILAGNKIKWFELLNINLAIFYAEYYLMNILYKFWIYAVHE